MDTGNVTTAGPAQTGGSATIPALQSAIGAAGHFHLSRNP